jgi:hypothetical protein
MNAFDSTIRRATASSHQMSLFRIANNDMSPVKTSTDAAAAMSMGVCR